jgi:hypothetical protein
MIVLVRWRAPDPGSLGARLAERLRLPRPDPDAAPVAFVLDGGVLVLERAESGTPERLASIEELDAGTAPLGARPSRIALLGVGWATVELDRASAEVGRRFGLRATGHDAVDDGWLGARARVLEPTGSEPAGSGSPGTARRLPPEPLMVLLEPATEGRIAASLARLGEGPVALYLSLPGPAGAATRPGPLGAADLLHARSPWGPFVLAVARGADGPVASPAGTIGS